MKGIYKITCINNNKVYIGKSIEIKQRFKKHLSDLRLNKHHSKYLQHSYNKYGEESLRFEIIEVNNNWTEEELANKEIAYIKQYNSFIDGFNETEGGEGRARIVSEEEKAQMSLRVRGNKNPMYGRTGSKNPNARLTDKEAKMIYVYFNSPYNGEYTQQGVADYFHVSRDTIKRIRNLSQHKYLKNFDLSSDEAQELLEEFLNIFKSQPQAKSKCNRLRKV